ncbi:MAG: NADH-quinone oxidoreductase subunit C [Gammaproteobacteria bacterium]|nr:MAG: NADH-quinone oxidoreductase subunit C [Gammaproteobacteria bacterium]
MSTRAGQLETRVRDALTDRALSVTVDRGEVTVELPVADLIDCCRILRDEDGLRFDLLNDLCAVDYLMYGDDEWKTSDATTTGFSRSVSRAVNTGSADRRFAIVYHLLSISGNQRLRVKTFAPDGDPPVVPSVVGIWPGANWFEREAFDLFGVLFDGHPDLRRLLTDYGFIGHPFRKDFPLSGNVEVRYDPDKARVVYEPVSIEPRTLVPRVIRDDNRYKDALRNVAGDEGADHG